ncbi:MAG: adenylosuccinate synthetase, partial [Sediminibacterium sp.]
MKKATVIVGLGYGDEGKGLLTDYYCHNADRPLVIRFNGGQQAGHTVVLKNGTRHVFSNFGSGTLRGVSTYWSAYCTFSPRYFLEELSLLPITPMLYLDPACPVTTHYDVLYNRALEISRGKNRYGS